MKYILTSEELDLIVKEVEVLKELEEEDKTIVWLADAEEYQRVKLVKNESVYDTEEDAIKNVIDMYDKRIKEIKEDQKEWKDKLK